MTETYDALQVQILHKSKKLSQISRYSKVDG